MGTEQGLTSRAHPSKCEKSPHRPPRGTPKLISSTASTTREIHVSRIPFSAATNKVVSYNVQLRHYVFSSFLFGHCNPGCRLAGSYHRGPMIGLITMHRHNRSAGRDTPPSIKSQNYGGYKRFKPRLILALTEYLSYMKWLCASEPCQVSFASFNDGRPAHIGRSLRLWPWLHQRSQRDFLCLGCLLCGALLFI